ncbi:hypothetical protein L799_19340 [Enterobacter roggenkampii EC_38VIM1]|nr:hypothetical protein L799_19340 [Enterobacter roggenkampii EC_38VIM1]
MPNNGECIEYRGQSLQAFQEIDDTFPEEHHDMGILIFKDIFNILLGCLISVKVNLGSVDPVLIEDRTIPLKCEAAG